MKTVYPSYYNSFYCIADKCKHSCCVGWEIGIDADTCDYYKSVPGDFGERLRASIDKDSTFILKEGDRCPFLNERGLCDIICELGEDALCQICADHPRFVNSFSDRDEIGLGLCCEAVCTLVLSQNEPFMLICEGDEVLTKEEKRIIAIRDGLFEMLTDRSRRLDARIEDMIASVNAKLPERTNKEWYELYSSLERLDHTWDTCLDALKCDAVTGDFDIPYEQLLAYFIYRHVSAAKDMADLRARLLLACLSVKIIRHICEAGGGELCEVARLYSAEIEYSEENTEKLIEVLRH